MQNIDNNLSPQNDRFDNSNEEISMSKCKPIKTTIFIIAVVFAIPLIINDPVKADSCEHAWSEWEVEYEATCQEEGTEERYCKKCYESQVRTIPKTSHKFDWETIKKSTVYKKGLKIGTCDYCEKVVKKAIPKNKMTASGKKARRVVISYLKAAKKYKVKKMNKCFAKLSKQYGYPTKKINWIYKKHNKKIAWRDIDVIKKSQRKIIVIEEVTRPNLYNKAYNAFYSSLWWSWNKWGFSADKHGKETAARYMKKYSKKAKKCKVKTKLVKFKVIKTKKGWKIEKKTRLMVDIATGFSNEAIDDAIDQFATDVGELYM